MNGLPTRFFATGVFLGLIGMFWGIQMSITQNFTLSPAHAHLNLIGFVAMSVYGTFYALSPSARGTKIAALHYWVSVVSILVFIPGIVMALKQTSSVGAKLGSVLVVLSMLLFGYNLLKHGIKSRD